MATMPRRLPLAGGLSAGEGVSDMGRPARWATWATWITNRRLARGRGRARGGARRSSGAAEYSHRWEHGFSAGTQISAPSWAATDVQARAWGPGKPGALPALPIPCKRTKAHKSAFGARDKLW